MMERMSAFAGPRALAPLFSVLAAAACSHVQSTDGDGGIGPGTDPDSETESATEAPLCEPQLQAIFGVGDDVYAAGTCGLALHRAGGEWHVLDLDASADFAAVWGSGPNDVFVAGSRKASVPAETPYECDDFWDGGGCTAYSAAVFRFDGTSWELSLERPKNSWFLVIGGRASEVIVAGRSDAEDVALFRFDGFDWEGIQNGPFVQDARAVWSVDGMGWIADSAVVDLDGNTRCFVSWFDGVGTGQVCPDDHFECNDMWMDEDGRFVTVGEGVIVSYDGVSCSFDVFPDVPCDDLYAVWGRSTDDVWAAGGLGTVLRRSGGVWSEIPVSEDLAHVSFVDGWASADAVYVVGNDYVGSGGVEWAPLIAAYRDEAWSVEWSLVP
jgi:hypothetical protein